MEERTKYLIYTADNYLNNTITGGNRRFREIIHTLLTNGDEVILLAPEDIDIKREGKLTIVPIKAYESKLIPNGLLNFLLNRKAFKKAKKANPEKTILFSFPYGIQGVLAGFPEIILFIRQNFFESRTLQRNKRKNFLQGITSLLYKKLERYTFKKVKILVVQCNYDKEAILTRHPGLADILEKKITLVPNNVNPSWIRQYEHLIQEEPKKGKDKFRFVFIGNLNSKLKGAHILLESVKMLLLNDYNVGLTIIGDGINREYYQKKYENYHAIKFLGYRKNALECLSESDLLVVPSLSDSYPNTILEGLFLQIPVIGSRRGGIPEILQYPELLFEPEVNSLYLKLKEILDKERFDTYFSLCLERKKALMFDWEKHINNIL